MSRACRQPQRNKPRTLVHEPLVSRCHMYNRRVYSRFHIIPGSFFFSSSLLYSQRLRPSSPMAEAEDLKSFQYGFKSHLGHPFCFVLMQSPMTKSVFQGGFVIFLFFSSLGFPNT